MGDHNHILETVMLCRAYNYI